MTGASKRLYRLSHDAAHYRFRCSSSSIVTYMFSCRSARSLPAPDAKYGIPCVY
jgi:hypothetical protein